MGRRGGARWGECRHLTEGEVPGTALTGDPIKAETPEDAGSYAGMWLNELPLISWRQSRSRSLTTKMKSV